MSLSCICIDVFIAIQVFWWYQVILVAIIITQSRDTTTDRIGLLFISSAGDGEAKGCKNQHRHDIVYNIIHYYNMHAE